MKRRFASLILCLLLIFSLLPAKVRAEPGTAFSFAAIADCHLETSTQRKRLESAIRNIGGQLPTLDCGDIGTNPGERPYKDYANITRGLVKAVAGNHDLPNLRYFQQYVGPDQHRFVSNGVLFVGFNGDPRYFDAKWLESQIRGFTGPIVLFNHYPVITPKEYQSYLMNPTPRQEVFRLISLYNVVAFVSGHVHEPFIIKNSKTTFVGIPSLGKKGSFVRIAISGENVSVTFAYVFL